MIARIVDYLANRWIGSCPHEAAHVAADILEGGAEPINIEVQYCRRCGAVRPSYTTEWRRPRPLWFPRGGREK
jgi:hypothetical protein